MLLYMGGGKALAAYLRRQRALIFGDCAACCGELSRLGCDRLGARGGDRAALAAAVALAEDCRALCSLAAALTTRGSDLTSCVLPACADACRRCIEACDRLSAEEVATRCAESCRRAEAVCARAFAVLAA